MNGIYVTVTGVVATDPQAKVIDDGLRVTSFRLASVSRKKDRNGHWVDGDTTWMSVSCWRGLAANVAESIAKKDRVLVHGRLRTDEWTASDGTPRQSLELDADAIGHDLAFGTSAYTRVRRSEPVRERERPDADQVVGEVRLAAVPDLEPALEPDEEEVELAQPVLAGSR